ncbi:MAG TPA: hypothetical protein VIO15_06390 [Bacteroidales bacterium]
MRIVNSTMYFDELILNSMFYCQHGKHGCNCFFQWVQKKSTPDKAAWFRSLTDHDKRELVISHLKCKATLNDNYKAIAHWQNN